MRKSFGWAVLAYLVPTFPLGYFWHLVTFADRYRALQMYRDEVLIPLGLASMLIQGLIFSWIYPRLFSTARDAWVGSALSFALVFGCVFGFLMLASLVFCSGFGAQAHEREIPDRIAHDDDEEDEDRGG